MRNAIVSILIVCFTCFAADQNIVNDLNLNGNTLKRVASFTKPDNTTWSVVDEDQLNGATNAIGSVWGSYWMKPSGAIMSGNLEFGSGYGLEFCPNSILGWSPSLDVLGAFSNSSMNTYAPFSVSPPVSANNATTKAYVDAAVASVSTPAKVIRVATSGGDQTTITGAVAMASSGDLIEIAPGTYTCSPILLTKTITISGMSPNNNDTIIVIDSTYGSDRFITFSSANITLSLNNVTLKDFVSIASSGGTIFNSLLNTHLDVNNCKFVNSVSVSATATPSSYGGAIYFNTTAGNMSIRNSSFVGCIAQGGYGGAIYVSTGSSYTNNIENCVFKDCRALTVLDSDSVYGGAIYANNSVLNGIRCDGCFVGGVPSSGSVSAAGGAFIVGSRLYNYITDSWTHNLTNGLAFSGTSTGNMIVTNGVFISNANAITAGAL